MWENMATYVQVKACRYQKLHRPDGSFPEPPEGTIQVTSLTSDFSLVMGEEILMCEYAWLWCFVMAASVANLLLFLQELSSTQGDFILPRYTCQEAWLMHSLTHSNKYSRIPSLARSNS